MWKRIENIMQLNNINQRQLAKKMQVSPGTLTELKKGRIKKPSFDLMCKFADALGVSLEELREKED
ncbi:XRE family transcriptional regulator [Latilactobacillus curvatus]|uniref:helix-turn-helix domain-containing protein n=1 Tax=Latilactobacillus curvatus TaxID=28038 RepID=UPI000F7CFAFE|nr:helix-turn-helix transcriptional regulator [Latilactobacillus curvatus]AZP96130.1 XRE family transcriptional regulator [Latilactobacillus curvatus]